MKRNKILIPVIVFTLIIIFLLIVLNLHQDWSTLSISNNKWNNIKEKRIESGRIALEEIKFNDYKLIIDKKSNTIYYSIVNDSLNKYNPNVSFITNKNNTKLAILQEEITEEKVKSNYKYKIMIYDEKEYHEYTLICTDLPIINISYKQEIDNEQKNIPMELYVFNNLSNTPNKITMSSGKIKNNEDNYTFSLNVLTPRKK